MSARKDVDGYSSLYAQIAQTPLTKTLEFPLPLAIAKQRQREWNYYCAAVRNSPKHSHLLEGCNGRKTKVVAIAGTDNAILHIYPVDMLDDIDKLMLAQMPDLLASVGAPLPNGNGEVMPPQKEEPSAYQNFMADYTPQAARAESEPQPSPIQSEVSKPVDIYSTAPSSSIKTMTREEAEAYVKDRRERAEEISLNLTKPQQ